MSVQDSIVNSVMNAVKGDNKSDKSEKSAENVEPKDFFWDQIVKYLSSIILVLTVLNVTVQLFRDGGVSCFFPPDTIALLLSLPDIDSSTINGFTVDQASFLNNYCIGSIPSTEFFPVFILAHGLLLVAPQFIWSAIYKGDFDSFFSIAGKIDRLRDAKTGEYSEKNFDRVKKLEVEYGGSKKKIFVSYVGKLCIQLVVCGVSIGLSAGWLQDFSFSFRCPRQLAEERRVPEEWPLNITVPCVYTSLRILGVVRIADFILTAIAAVLIMYGLLWCVIRHTEQLGHVQVAKFTFESCLKPELYVFPPVVHFRVRRFLKLIQKDYEVKGCMRHVFWLLNFNLSNCFFPRIKNDLDFLLLQLFRADASHGKVFKDIQVNKEFRQLFGRDQQLLRLYVGLQADRNSEYRRMKREGKDIQQESTLTHRRATNGSVQGGSKRTAPIGGEEGGEREREEKRKRRARWCANCVVCWCRCCLKKRPLALESGGENATDSARENWLNYQNFRQIFLESGIGRNREKMAFEYFRPHLGNLDAPEVEESEDGVGNMCDRIYWFICEHGKIKDDGNKEDGHRYSNYTAVDVSFGTTGYPLVLSRAYKEVVSVNFHPFYRAENPVVKKQEFFSNYYIITYPDDIYTRNNHHQNDANTMLLKHFEESGKCIDMIIVGPVANEPQKISVNIFLSLITLEKYIGKDGLLLALRPLKIGSKKVTSFKYVPSKKLFGRITKESLSEEEQKKLYCYVDGQKGYKVHCAGVSCIFEFEAYRYCGPVKSPSEQNNSTNISSDQMGMNEANSHSNDIDPDNLSHVTNQEESVHAGQSDPAGGVSGENYHNIPVIHRSAPILVSAVSHHSLSPARQAGSFNGATPLFRSHTPLSGPSTLPATALSINASSPSVVERNGAVGGKPAMRALSDHPSLRYKATSFANVRSSNSLRTVAMGGVDTHSSRPHDALRLSSPALNGEVETRRSMTVDKNSRSTQD